MNFIAIMKKYSTLVVLITFSLTTYSQTNHLKNWYLLNPATDSFAGISLQKAYQFLQAKKLSSTTTTVAIMDSGIDTLQEDLKANIWHNTKEIPNNNIDDDNNGYIDDVYGWNFLGNKNGENVSSATTEGARIYHQFKSLYKDKNIDTLKLSPAEKQQYKMWQQTAESVTVTTDKEIETTLVKMTLNSIKSCDKTIRSEMNVKEYTAAQLEKFTPKTAEGKNSKLNYLLNIQLLQIDIEEKNTAVISQLEEYLVASQKTAKEKTTEPIDYRATIIKDNYNNINDNHYGNNNVSAAFIMHGTFVAGIIGANRINNIGINGIADNVKLMPVRVVPEGDEYDKDIALGIFYAVNNGAKVINMSFGKHFSPQKFWVDSAIKYAESKDVLIVHAAGNDTENIDSIAGFPTPIYNNGIKAQNFITVGASTDPQISGSGYIASFSNYGKNLVDVFAPGVKIYSTMPGISEYAFEKGTSFSAPIVSGIAALIRSYFPKLSAVQAKQIIEKSVYNPTTNTSVKSSNIFADSNDTLTLQNACKTGGIVSAAKAVEEAYNFAVTNNLL